MDVVQNTSASFFKSQNKILGLEIEDFIIVVGIIAMLLISIVYVVMLFVSRRFSEKDSQSILNENRSITTFADIKSTPVVKDNPIVYPTDIVLFKNRKSGKYLSTCSDCLKPVSDIKLKASVMHLNDKPYELYNQWSLMFNSSVDGYNFYNKQNGYITFTDMAEISITTDNIQSGSLISLIGYDSQGYLIKNVNADIGEYRLRASNDKIEYYSKNSDSGVILVNAYDNVIEEDIWDMYLYKDNQIILQNPVGEQETMRKISERSIQLKHEEMGELVNNTITTLRGLKL